MKSTKAEALLTIKPRNKAERHNARSKQDKRSDAAIGEGDFKSSALNFRDVKLLTNSFRLPHPDLRHRPPHHRGDLPHLLHQFVELIGEERLRTVG